jgi:hypothetical protein
VTTPSHLRLVSGPRRVAAPGVELAAGDLVYGPDPDAPLCLRGPELHTHHAVGPADNGSTLYVCWSCVRSAWPDFAPGLPPL